MSVTINHWSADVPFRVYLLYTISDLFDPASSKTHRFLFCCCFFICAGENNVVGSDSMTCSEPENYPIILITHEPVLLWKSLIANAITQTSDLCFFTAFLKNNYKYIFRHFVDAKLSHLLLNYDPMTDSD